jgi:hypothetical protein
MPGQATVTSARGATGSRWRVDHWFYIDVALFMMLLNVAAFGPSLVTATERWDRSRGWLPRTSSYPLPLCCHF